MTVRAFDFDDYPWFMDQFLAVADRLKKDYPKFCCTAFAIPKFMYETPRAWDELEKRSDWIRVGVHGFEHAKRETRFPHLYEKGRHWLDKVEGDDRWSRIFKGPWNGYCEPLVEDLRQRGYKLSTKQLYGFPMPMPLDLQSWSLVDHRAAQYSALEDNLQLFDGGIHVESHPVWPPGCPARVKSRYTEISDRNIKKWTRLWASDDEFDFVENMTRPACLKLNLGCEDQVWPGWVCLDNRADKLNNGSVQWDFSRMIPYSELKADVIFSGHTFEYLAEEDYTKVLLECWRVLRPDGVLRLSQLDGYAWRQPGQNSRGTGEIKSVPTKAKIYTALRQIGFEIHDAGPGETLSPHKDVLLGDSRERLWRRGRKFYCEAVKRLPETFDISRPRGKKSLPGDIRATKRGARYRLPDQALQKAADADVQGPVN